MTRDNALRVLVATDGSAQARAAVAATGRFPWPDRTRVRIVVARRTRAEYRQSILLAALDRFAQGRKRSRLIESSRSRRGLSYCDWFIERRRQRAR